MTGYSEIIKIDEAKEEGLKKLMEHTKNEEDKFWEKYYDDESMANDLLDDTIKIMNLQKGIIQNLLVKIKILSHNSKIYCEGRIWNEENYNCRKA